MKKETELFRKVYMRTDCDCMVASLAMLLQCPYESAAQFFPSIAINKRGYHWDYLIPFLKANGIFLNWMPSKNEVNWDNPAMLDVVSLTAPDKGDHIIFWDGKQVIDPSNKDLKYINRPDEINCAYQINEKWTQLPLVIPQPEKEEAVVTEERQYKKIHRLLVAVLEYYKTLWDGEPKSNEDVATNFLSEFSSIRQEFINQPQQTKPEVNYVQSIPFTFDDYMKLDKGEIIKMLLECHRIIGQPKPSPDNGIKSAEEIIGGVVQFWDDTFGLCMPKKDVIMAINRNQSLPTITDSEIEMHFPSEVGQSVIMEKDMSYDDVRQANYYRRQGAKAMRDGKIKKLQP